MQAQQAGKDSGRELPGQAGERGGAAGADAGAGMVELPDQGLRGQRAETAGLVPG